MKAQYRRNLRQLTAPHYIGPEWWWYVKVGTAEIQRSTLRRPLDLQKVCV